MIRTDIDRDAPVVVRVERVVPAPVARLWSLHVDVPRWPEWQEDVTAAEMRGDFVAGAAFTWTAAGLDEPVTSTIYAVEPLRSTLWGGPSAGITGVHHRSFNPLGEHTAVVTEESWAGAPVEADPERARQLLERSLQRWLDFLEAAATAA